MHSQGPPVWVFSATTPLDPLFAALAKQHGTTGVRACVGFGMVLPPHTMPYFHAFWHLGVSPCHSLLDVFFMCGGIHVAVAFHGSSSDNMYV